MCVLPCRTSSAWLTKDSPPVLLANKGFLIVLAEITSPLILLTGLRGPPGGAEIFSLEKNLLLCDHWLMGMTLSVYLTISSNSVVSTRGDLCPQGTFDNIWRHFCGGKGALASSR